MFLATLIVAAKYLNDSSPKNKHWALFARLFEPAEINLMEKQLLFLLDYDLRFDESEAMAHFAPFMSRRLEFAKETRATAVTRAKARVQAQVSLPPTPPHDVVPARIPSPEVPTFGVQSLVKRLSSTYLSISSGNPSARPRALSRASSSSTLGTASASGDSESGCLTSSSAYSSPATSISSASDCEVELKDDLAMNSTVNTFVLQAVPSHAVRQGRKVSTASTCTIKGDPTTGEKQLLSPSTSIKRVGFEVDAKPGMGRGSSKRSTLQASGQAQSGGFLSRMFGSSNKLQVSQDKDLSIVDLSDSVDVQGTSSTLRRLAHSKSTLFRGQPSQGLDI